MLTKIACWITIEMFIVGLLFTATVKLEVPTCAYSNESWVINDNCWSLQVTSDRNEIPEDNGRDGEEQNSEFFVK